MNSKEKLLSIFKILLDIDYSKQNKIEKIELLQLKLNELKSMNASEMERSKIVDNKASMFIGSTSIMGAIIAGCTRIIPDVLCTNIFFNIATLTLIIIQLYFLLYTIMLALNTLRKRTYWYIEPNDINATNKEAYFTNMNKDMTKILKHNQKVINSKVDSMSEAQSYFAKFWTFAFIYVTNILVLNIFGKLITNHSSSLYITVTIDIIFCFILYLCFDHKAEKLRNKDFTPPSQDNK